MGLRSLAGFLERHRRIALDTNVFIYELEANPRYVGLTRQIFEWIARPNHSAVTSTITMTELLVVPYREGNPMASDMFYAFLATYPNLEWIAPDLAIADLAAMLRAKHKFRTPDALQAATAIASKATALVTNDVAFSRVDLVETLVLDSLL